MQFNQVNYNIKKENGKYKELTGKKSDMFAGQKKKSYTINREERE